MPIAAQKGGFFISFILLPRSHHPHRTRTWCACACVCARLSRCVFSLAPRYLAHTLLVHTWDSCDRPFLVVGGGIEGSPPSWWRRITTSTNLIYFPHLNSSHFFHTDGAWSHRTRTAVSRRWRLKMGITIMHPVESLACAPYQRASTEPAIGRNSRHL